MALHRAPKQRKETNIPLIDLELSIVHAAIPADVVTFLHEADCRIRHYQRRHHPAAGRFGANCGFIPSGFERAYHVFIALAEADLAPGNLFCEWGSGFGVVACLAAMLDFDAFGIEVEGELVDAAQQLAGDFHLPVEFAHGSFIPKGGEGHIKIDDRYSWLNVHEGDAHRELGFAPEDFAVIYAYPWPDEEQLIERLFERFAGVGALLVTYHEGDDYRVRQKTNES